MSDLIDRMEAMEAILHAGIYKNFESDYTNGIAEGLLSAMEEVKKLPSANQWIPVTERLPEDDDDVLICWDGTVEVGYYKNGEWLAENWNGLEIDAWMPLPEPYREDE